MNARAQRNQAVTRILFMCGGAAGPLFIATLLVQDYTRPGFDPRIHALSLLSLGDWGWIQILNFVITGMLNILYAVGLWRSLHPGRAGTWGPLLIGAYGVGLVAVGIFRTDPAAGFPPGATAPPHPSWHGVIHALGALFVFMTLVAALLVLARYFFEQKEPRWGWYSLICGLLLLGTFFAGFGGAALMARFLRLGVLFGWGAASVIAIHFLRNGRTVSQATR